MEKIWNRLEKAIEDYSSRRSDRELKNALKGLEKALKQGVDKRVEDSREKERKYFQIEIMIRDFKRNLETAAESEGGEKPMDTTEENTKQTKIGNWSDK
ncbi:hypothetical protein AKJ41_06350 [candidate division MSBL1 archaeon SCGC-AAA259O05]|uniref:Uncharacterized protein n=1 Tax=candidate division MSBL1 archaeon SCGC-AAA259O05 TaxID=1698271 RepID=A0A133UX10_9EURY|nr:hypothetical protein AKJ41_06350 [candidate division MSBL1 archaeon SCGC-AAA259O05]